VIGTPAIPDSEAAIWRPALEVRRISDAFVVEEAVAGIDPTQFDVQVTPTELVLAAHVRHGVPERAASRDGPVGPAGDEGGSPGGIVSRGPLCGAEARARETLST
jgi:hypothetical protein